MGESKHIGCLRKENKNSGTVGRWRKKKKKEDGERSRRKAGTRKMVKEEEARIEFHMDFKSTLALPTHRTRVFKT